MLGIDYIECLVEMSKSKRKFHIVVLDLLAEKFHTIELSHKQFDKLHKICDNSFEKKMKLIDFKLDRIVIKHIDVLMNYERYMPEKAELIK